MKISFASILVVIFLQLFNAVSFAQPSNEVFYSGQLWVQMDPAATKNIVHNRRNVNIDSFSTVIGKNLAENFELVKVEKPFFFARTNEISEVYQLFFASEQSEESFARELSRLSAVKYAERIPIVRPTLTPNDLGPQSGSGNQWGLWKINAQNAWNISTGSSEIRVAIVDDAVLTTHPDLIPNLVPGYDVADDDNDPMPNEVAMSHGTHVAGIVGAATNNNTGVASIGFGLKIIPVKSSNVPQTISDAYSGVIWAADNGADVINMSWGSEGYSNTGQNIINYAHDAGCVNVAASGNDNVSNIFYPAGYNNVISVSSTNSGDFKSDFSNFGNWVDVSAPGSQILSTYIGNGFQPVYANNSGTSMASPMVAGLAGLVLSVNPELSQQQVIDCILNTADNIAVFNPNYLGQLGSGRINAQLAVLCAQATINAPPVSVITSSNTVACPGGLVQFFGSSAGGSANNYSWFFEGGNPATSSDQNPIVAYAEPGFYDVSLNVSNDFGEHDLTLPNFIEISTNGTDIIFSEDFEAGTFTGSNWTVDNPDGAIGWEITTVAGSEPGNKAARVNHFSYNATGQRDGLITPAINLSNHSNVQLDFQHAHRRYSADYSDSLIVYVSTDGGETFPDRVLAVAENGGGTFATGTLFNQNFVPANESDWCITGDVGAACFSLDLSEYDGETDVRIKFETFNDFGNNIYIDNIQLFGNCQLTEAAPVADFNVFPAAICAGESVQFTDQSVNVPTTYLWTFEGGSPATSDLAAPVVVYAAPGIYDVTLSVTNAFGSDEITYENIVTVSTQPEVIVDATEITVCAGEPAILSASGADEFSWSPDIALSATTGSVVEASPAASIVYTVTATSNGCSVSENIIVDVLPGPTIPTVVYQNEIAFAVLSPPAVSGHYGYSGTSTANGWGNAGLASVSVEGELIIARDASTGDSLLCFNAINNVAGKIAVVYRGDCEFGTKAFQAQNAGALAVVVINNAGGAPIDMGPGAQGAQVNIPVIMVSDATGAWINASVYAGEASAVVGQFNGNGLMICPGETMRLAAPGGWNQYLWSDNSNSGVIQINEAGDYSVEIFAENGCSNESESFTVGLYDVEQPIIESDGSGGLEVNNVDAGSYVWFFNGEIIPGADGNFLNNIADGSYTVETTDANGCSSSSEPYVNVTTGISQLASAHIQIFPVPATDRITISIIDGNNIESISVFTSEGRQVFSQSQFQIGQKNIELNLESWASGSYVVRISDGERINHTRFIKVL